MGEIQNQSFQLCSGGGAVLQPARYGRSPELAGTTKEGKQAVKMLRPVWRDAIGSGPTRSSPHKPTSKAWEGPEDSQATAEVLRGTFQLL